MPSKHTAGCFLLGLMFLLPPILRAQPGSSFNAFSDSLVTAIERGNTDWVFSRVDSSVFNGFGYNSGIDTFKRLWSDPVVELDEELLVALHLGPAFTEDRDRVFVPFIWLKFPDSLDAYRYGYSLQDEVPVYSAPLAESKVVDTLRTDWVEVFSWFEGDIMDAAGNPLWVGVTTPAVDSGYVKESMLRSPIDYRFWFDKRDGRWNLAGWAAGD